MTSVRDVVGRLVTGESGRPRLTWYGPDSERVELSGRVLGTWLAKATNLLLDEGDAGPGARVVVDLPPHWRAVVWAVAAWSTGAEVVLDPGEAPATIVVTDRPDDAPAGGLVLAVPLPALAMRWPGLVPPGALDGAADLMAQADVVGWLPALVPSAPALAGTAHADLLAWAGARCGAEAWPPAPRVLWPARAAADVLAAALAAWDRDGSLVLVAEGVPVERVAGQERVSVRAQP